MPLFSQLERQIVQALVAHISQNEEVSLTELADEVHVSKSSVVRAVQKLGYRGFPDLTYSVRFNAQSDADMLLPRHVMADSGFDDAAETLARCLLRCAGKRNLIFSGDRRLGALIASYMSRKLAMFDIFAPPSYDYAMTVPGALPCGVAFFCFHRELPGRSVWGQQDGYGEGMLAAARSTGFYVVAFSDNVAPRPSDADLLLRVAPNERDDLDLYAARVIMLFEAALARYAGLLDATCPSQGDGEARR